jgi:hypothetical protein
MLVEGRDYTFPRGVDSAKVIRVIETVAARGSGKDDANRCRAVRQYWSLEGELLAEFDPLHDFSVGHIFPPYPPKEARDA